MYVKLASRSVEKNSSATVTKICYAGIKEEISAKLWSDHVGSVSDYGKLETARMYQESPAVWCLEQSFTTACDGTAPDEKPLTVYGKKSATLKGSMLSVPIEAHPKYLACWNHYLAASYGVTDVPDWWETAKHKILSQDDAQIYAWVKSIGEASSCLGGRWTILKEPLKPGVDTYDIAAYSITETARYKTAKAAGKAVSGKLNRIGMPCETFAITGGSWKCDDASVSYDGEDWFATLSWTRSGDDAGWDQDLYGNS